MSIKLPDYKEFDTKVLLPFSKIRLVAVDLDGTLLKSSDSVLPKIIIDLANKLNHHKYDVRLTVATGRTLNGVKSLLDTLPIRKDTPIILYNGNVILNKRFELININKINSDALVSLINIVYKYNVKMIAYSYDWFVGNEPKEHAYGWAKQNRTELDYNKLEIQWCEQNDCIDEISPSAIVIYTQDCNEITQQLTYDLNNINSISYSFGKNYIEVLPKNSNKGTALTYVADRLSLSREQVLAIGDNDNDAEMLRWAGIGVAVESASELAINSSDYVAKRGVIEGAVEAMKLVHSARRLFVQS
jgi:Cof subfamily protein (haloacid dehalogenase superfamily)